MKRSRTILLAAVALGLAMILLLTGRRTGAGVPRHLIIISLDTTRADMWGFYGNPWIKTPNMDRLAAESVVLEDLMTVAPTTLASHTSLFTGNYPQRHGVPLNGYIVSDENLMLAEILKKEGFSTVGFAGSFALDSRFNIAQGFDIYDANLDIPLSSEVEQTQRRGDAVTDAVIARLDGMKTGNNGFPKRLFLFAHYFDAHHPYDAPEPYGSMYAGRFGAADHSTRGDLACGEALPAGAVNEPRRNPEGYAGEISYLDAQIGRLLDYIREEGILDDALLVVVSDHGESFWDHVPHFHHGRAVYQTPIHIVGLLRFPRGAHAGLRYKPLAANTDILPTILREMRIGVPKGLDGEALDLGNAGASPPDHARFAEASQAPPGMAPDPTWINRPKTKCIRKGKYKFVWTPYLRQDDGPFRVEELYDLETDPCEQRNLLVNATPETLRIRTELRVELEAWMARAAPLKSEFDKEQFNDTMKRLQDLGYFDKGADEAP